MQEEISKEFANFEKAAKKEKKEFNELLDEEAERMRAEEIQRQKNLEGAVVIDGKATTGHADLNGETVIIKADGTVKDQPKAPSIRGNLKLIKELTKRVNEFEIFIDRALKELGEGTNRTQEEFMRLNDRLSNLSAVDTSNKNVIDAERISNLEQCIAKMAHYTGGNNPRICKEFGIEVYEVKLKDMSRY